MRPLRRRGRRPARRRNPAAERREFARLAQRPAVINQRERLGDWEGDLLLGGIGSSGLLTLTDRRSKDLLLRKSAANTPIVCIGRSAKRYAMWNLRAAIPSPSTTAPSSPTAQSWHAPLAHKDIPPYQPAVGARLSVPAWYERKHQRSSSTNISQRDRLPYRHPIRGSARRRPSEPSTTPQPRLPHTGRSLPPQTPDSKLRFRVRTARSRNCPSTLAPERRFSTIRL